MTQHAIWDSRWQTLDAVLAATEAGLQRATVDRAGTLRALLAALRAFGESQFRFFYDGFFAQQGIRLEPSYTYPPEYVLRTLLDEIAVDLTLIRQAINQRNHALSTAEEREGLLKADVLAQQALNPAIPDLLPNTAVVTYFQKAAVARIIPYARVILIGVPYSAIANSRDYLATAHEVGHYVFRYGQSKAGRFRTVLEQRVSMHAQPAWCQAWLEEIFADVYGTLVAGPVAGWGIQDLLNDNSLKELKRDDGEHPWQPIRPYIHTETLDEIDASLAAVVLEDRWEAYLAERGQIQTFVPAGYDSDEIVKRKHAHKAVEETVELILESLGDLRPARRWSDDLSSAQEDANQLFTRFDAYVQALEAEGDDALRELALSHDGQTITLNGDTRAVGATDLWIDALKAAKEQGVEFSMPPNSWLALRSAGGWADRPGNGEGFSKGVE